MSGKNPRKNQRYVLDIPIRHIGALINKLTSPGSYNRFKYSIMKVEIQLTLFCKRDSK